MLIVNLFLSCDAAGAIENLGSRNTIKVCTIGFESARAERILKILLRQPEVILDSRASTESDLADTGGFHGVTAQLLEISEDKPLVATCAYQPFDKYSDAAFLFLDASDLHNENSVILRFMQCFKSVLSSDRQSPLLIVFTGPAASVSKVEFFLRESWLLLLDEEEVSKAVGQNDSLFSRLSVSIVLTPFSVSQADDLNSDSRASVSQVLDSLNASARRFDDCFGVLNGAASATEQPSATVPSQIPSHESTELVGRRHSVGMELAQEGVDIAMQWAMDATNSSIARLSGQLEQPEHFAQFMKNLAQSAEQILQDHFTTYQTNHYGAKGVIGSAVSTAAGSINGNGANSAVVALAKRDLHHQLFQRLLPLYKRQVQVARGSVAKAFNSLVFGEDSVLVPSVHVMQDLDDLVKESLQNFTSLTQRLSPSIAPRSTWNALFERFEYAQTLAEYVSNREAEFRKMGVLPRGAIRPLVDLSVHAFVPHPLGLRDYKQDVLGDTARVGRDAIMFDPLLASAGGASSSATSPSTATSGTGVGLVKPGLARRALQQEVSQIEESGGGRSRSALAPSRLLGLAGSGRLQQCHEQSEFAREMLMFPLSIKNPAVAMAAGRRSGRRRKRSGPASRSVGGGGAPQKDSTRSSLGPERFLKWDLPPLDEAKRSIEASMHPVLTQHSVYGPASSSSSAAGKLQELGKAMDEALNVFPYFQQGYYRHPPINYGAEFSPSQSTVSGSISASPSIQTNAPFSRST